MPRCTYIYPEPWDNSKASGQVGGLRGFAALNAVLADMRRRVPQDLLHTV